ncbi:hypothetical protein D3C81_2143680 [compost metagenome]
MNMDVQGIALHLIAEAVDTVFELFAGEHPPAIVQQSLQQRLLAPGKVHWLAS